MTRIHAHDGSLMAEYARERRIFVPINVDPEAGHRAPTCRPRTSASTSMAVSISSASAAPSYKMAEDQIRGANRRAEGASTITQQVAKNFLLTSDRTLERKLKEAILAIRIERAYPEGQDPRAVSQRDLSRHRLLWRRCRRAQLFQQGAEATSPSRRRPTSPPCPRRPTTTIRSARPRRPRSGATGSSTRWPTTATSRPSRRRLPRPSR